ncbi:MAG TPA: hypothetical protein VHB79_36400 [Polyangiaceae bacterium]|nr:hypothetical protein [Polyangiaceae bacterium]
MGVAQKTQANDAPDAFEIGLIRPARRAASSSNGSISAPANGRLEQRHCLGDSGGQLVVVVLAAD